MGRRARPLPALTPAQESDSGPLGDSLPPLRRRDREKRGEGPGSAGGRAPGGGGAGGWRPRLSQPGPPSSPPSGATSSRPPPACIRRRAQDVLSRWFPTYTHHPPPRAPALTFPPLPSPAPPPAPCLTPSLPRTAAPGRPGSHPPAHPQEPRGCPGNGGPGLSAGLGSSGSTGWSGVKGWNGVPGPEAGTLRAPPVHRCGVGGGWDPHSGGPAPEPAARRAQ